MVRSVNVTVSSMILGLRLRMLREQAGLMAKTVAAEFDCSDSRISRIERGDLPIKAPELYAWVMKLCRVDRSEDEARSEWEILEGHRVRAGSGKRGWWTEPNLGLASGYLTYIEVENEAELIQSVAIGLVPGLLQTEDYIVAQCLSAGYPRAIADKTVQIRSQRRARLFSAERKLSLEVVLDEGLLHRCAHSGQVAQLRKLIEYAAEPNVTIRVLPCTVVHSASAMYSIITLPDNILPPIIYSDHPVGGVFIEDLPSAKEAMSRYYTTREQSLQTNESIELIEKIARKGENAGRRVSQVQFQSE